MPESATSDDLLAGLKNGLLLGAAVLALALPPARHQNIDANAAVVPTTAALASVIPRSSPAPARADLGDAQVSVAARHMADWVARSGDNQGLPFLILDKRNAQLLVFSPAARLQGDTPVLLGSAPGDHTLDGVGSKPIAEVRPEERTTPAGRFLAQTGRNTLPEDVLWVDYDAAVSIHRVRATDPRERRLERLASPTAQDNRISYGCINLPVAFFEQTLWPAVQAGRSVVYVLPEQLPLDEVFAASFAMPGHHIPSALAVGRL